MKRILDFIDNVPITKFISSIFILAMAVIMVMNVILRYCFHFSFNWSDEIIRYLCIYLFAAGVVPGILMGIVLCIWTVIMASKYGWGSRKKGISLRGVWRAFYKAIWAILMPVIILGGIYSGKFTPTEAAAVAAVYGTIVSLFIYRGIKFSDLLDLGFEAVRTSCMIMFICATANIFSFVVTRQQVPAKLSSLILGVTDNWVVILLIINVILLINGCFMETTASTYIYTPILFPLISALNYNPIQFGVVMVMNLTLGLITPPLGINQLMAK